MNIQIAPSLLAADFGKLGEEALAAEGELGLVLFMEFLFVYLLI